MKKCFFPRCARASSHCLAWNFYSCIMNDFEFWVWWRQRRWQKSTIEHSERCVNDRKFHYVSLHFGFISNLKMCPNKAKSVRRAMTTVTMCVRSTWLEFETSDSLHDLSKRQKKSKNSNLFSFFFSLSHSENATIPEDPRRFELPTWPSRTTRSLMANASVCQRSCRTDAVSAATQRPADNSWRTLGRLQRAAELLHSQSCHRAESVLIKARRLEHKDEAYANGDRWTSQSSRANRRQSIERIIGGS